MGQPRARSKKAIECHAPGAGDAGVEEGLVVQEDDQSREPHAEAGGEEGAHAAQQEQERDDKRAEREHEDAHGQALAPGHVELVKVMHQDVGEDGEGDKVVQGRAQDVRVVGLLRAVRVVEEVGRLLDRIVQELPVGEGSLVGHGPGQAPPHGRIRAADAPVLDDAGRDVAQVGADLRAVREAVHGGQDSVSQGPALLHAGIRGGQGSADAGPARGGQPGFLVAQELFGRGDVPSLARHRVVPGDVQLLHVFVVSDHGVDDEG